MEDRKQKEDVCDICGQEFSEKELFCIEDWKESKKKKRMDTYPYIVAAFSWACKKCLLQKKER